MLTNVPRSRHADHQAIPKPQNMDGPHEEPVLPDALTVIVRPLMGPLSVGDHDLLPLASRLVAVITSAAINLQNYAVGKTDERAASRRLSALTAVNAAGELRALVILCTTGLAMEGRIHLRTFDDCLRRLAVYWADPAFSRQIEETITHFQADGWQTPAERRMQSLGDNRALPVAA